MLILITGTIAPDKNLRQLTITDTQDRLEQYIMALKSVICKAPHCKIVFCENSGFGTEALEPVMKLANEKKVSFEALSFQGNNEEVVKHGKGYGEGEIVEYALNNSSLVKGEDYFIKLTGRLAVDNIGRISDLVGGKRLYFNVPNMHLRSIYDTRLYAMPISTFRKFFIDKYKNVNDDAGMILETVYTGVIRDNGLKVRNFPRYPRIVGVSGSSGVKYEYTEWKCRIRDVLGVLNIYGQVK